MNDASRLQGRLIAAGAALLALLFLVGILIESYWALAIPVAVLVFFVLGLVAWVGWTIATIQVEPESVEAPDAAPEAADDAAAADSSRTNASA